MSCNFKTIMHNIGKYRIDITLEDEFAKNSINKVYKYELAYLDEGMYEMSTMVGIKIFQVNALIKSAIVGFIGGRTALYDKSVIFEDSRFLICCYQSIFCLSIPALILIWRTRADQATCFGIFKYWDSYIVHGELEISRLDKNSKILWQQSGADIFTT